MLVCSRLKMFWFLVTFFSLFVVRCIENRICSGTRGFDCCYGYSLNKLTGKCDECSIGYHGHDCSIKCTPPTYGKACQTICNCSIEVCHFARGCLKKLRSTTDDARQYTSHPAVFKESSKTVTKSSIASEFFTDVNKHSDTTLIYMSTDTDVLKNDLVIGFIGIFAISFLIFVLTYIRMKCFRVIGHERGIGENEEQAHYKSLRFVPLELESTSHREQEEQLNAESAYITPV